LYTGPVSSTNQPEISKGFIISYKITTASSFMGSFQSISSTYSNTDYFRGEAAAEADPLGVPHRSIIIATENTSVLWLLAGGPS